ncbi:MAG: hypothetical protein IH864_02890 [Chloroflexi bacterium]|nr:hypothetical protein [Chloroflexota bacterium]
MHYPPGATWVPCSA